MFYVEGVKSYKHHAPKQSLCFILPCLPLHLAIYLPLHLAIYLPLHLAIYLPLHLAISFITYLNVTSLLLPFLNFIYSSFLLPPLGCLLSLLKVHYGRALYSSCKIRNRPTSEISILITDQELL